jgi:hypothetical protein
LTNEKFGLCPVLVDYDMPQPIISVHLSEDLGYIASRQKQPIPFLPVHTIAEMKAYKDLVPVFKLHAHTGAPLAEPRYHDFARHWNTDVRLTNSPGIYRKLPVHLEKQFKNYGTARHRDAFEATQGASMRLLTREIMAPVETHEGLIATGDNVLYNIAGEASNIVDDPVPMAHGQLPAASRPLRIVPNMTHQPMRPSVPVIRQSMWPSRPVIRQSMWPSRPVIHQPKRPSVSVPLLQTHRVEIHRLHTPGEHSQRTRVPKGTRRCAICKRPSCPGSNRRDRCNLKKNE